MSATHGAPGSTGALVELVGRDRRALSGWVAGRPGDVDGPRVVCERRGTCFGTVTLGPAASVAGDSAGAVVHEIWVHLLEPMPAGALITGEVQVATVSADGARAGLAVSKELADRERGALAEALGTGGSGLPAVGPASSAAREGNDRPSNASRLSPVGFPVGLAALDGSAELGESGHFFLTGGSNGLRSLYDRGLTDESRARTNHVASRWRGTFDARAAALTELGAAYVQCVVPEKLTALRHLHGTVDGPTNLLVAVEERTASCPYYVSLLSGELGGLATDPGSWLRYDTHLSPAGARGVFRGLMRAAGLDVTSLDEVDFGSETFYSGDLARRMFGMTLWDPQLDPSPGSGPLLMGEPPRLVHSVDPAESGHVGTSRVWRRDGAPVDGVAVAFANSFFERGQRPSAMSWWASRYFREFHFVWGGDVDLDYVTRVQPDLVIGQTVERFLGRVPAA